jgi:hypothetical protein
VQVEVQDGMNRVNGDDTEGSDVQGERVALQAVFGDGPIRDEVPERLPAPPQMA